MANRCEVHLHISPYVLLLTVELDPTISCLDLQLSSVYLETIGTYIAIMCSLFHYCFV